MAAGPIHTSWHEHFPLHPRHHRRVEPVQSCPPPKPCERDRFEPLPFDKFLERQNQEFRAAVERFHASHKQHACSKPDRSAFQAAPAGSSSTGWPRIGDVTPTAPATPVPKQQLIRHYEPPIRPGTLIDLWL